MMLKDLRIRAMGSGDLDALLAIVAGLAEAPVWPRSAYEAVIHPSGSPPRVALVAELRDGIAGFAVASLVERTAELESIAVAESVQRLGVATELMRALVQVLKAKGAVELVLEARTSNRGALEFYDRMGFLQIGVRPRYYRDPGEDAVILRLELEAT